MLNQDIVVRRSQPIRGRRLIDIALTARLRSRQARRTVPSSELRRRAAATMIAG
jgi:hypothetical protein